MGKLGSWRPKLYSHRAGSFRTFSRLGDFIASEIEVVGSVLVLELVSAVLVDCPSGLMTVLLVLVGAKVEEEGAFCTNAIVALVEVAARSAKADIFTIVLD